ncbi:MAG: 50S ribosomal protein L21 [Phycisphaerae bacterium]|nr:50S ribosomal protein L21 [Phycisphaerae bacterium]
MYAIIVEGGGQRKVMQDQELLIDLVNEGQAKPGQTVTFDRVLLLGGDAGAAKIGRPYVAGAMVTAEVLQAEVLGDKIDIRKFRKRKGYRRHTGHRQRYTKVKVTGIKG